LSLIIVIRQSILPRLHDHSWCGIGSLYRSQSLKDHGAGAGHPRQGLADCQAPVTANTQILID